MRLADGFSSATLSQDESCWQANPPGANTICPDQSIFTIFTLIRDISTWFSVKISWKSNCVGDRCEGNMNDNQRVNDTEVGISSVSILDQLRSRCEQKLSGSLNAFRSRCGSFLRTKPFNNPANILDRDIVVWTFPRLWSWNSYRPAANKTCSAYTTLFAFGRDIPVWVFHSADDVIFPVRFFFLFIILEPRVEWHKSLWA